MSHSIRAFIFDLDGVITDTAEFHYLAWKQLADEEGIPFTREDNEQLRGVSRRESLNRMLKGKPIDEATAENWMARKNDYYLRHLEEITPAHVLPGVNNFLKDAHSQGIILGIGSASKNAKIVLERLDIIQHFEAIGDGYSVTNTKPAPDLFIWVAGRLNVPPVEAVVFEDAEAGVDAALKGGFWTVGVGQSAIHHAHLVSQDGLATLPVDVVLKLFPQ
jgi:beta-phosphoglucomutase